MAVTRTLYTVEITAHDGTKFTAEDTAQASIGRNAIEKIKHGETVVIPGDETVYIPFHSVVYAKVTTSESTIDMTDDSCVKE